MIASAELHRLVPQWQPGVWIGCERRASEVVSEFIEVQDAHGPSSRARPGHAAMPAVVHTSVHMHPAQLLLALWPPQTLAQPLLPRWPQRVLLVNDGPDAGARALLGEMPAQARLWLAPQEVDAAFLAEVLLRSEPELALWQQQALRGFIERERAACIEQIGLRFRRGRALSR
jgi:hypothetical protein